MAGHGGVRPNAGRKRKADEEKIKRWGEDAIIKVYGSIQAYYEFIATQAKESFPHLKLLQEYVFGKPTERVIIEDEIIEDFDLSKMTNEELEVITKLHERQRPNTSDS